MDRKIYHGSPRIVRSPSFGAGRQHNDFGLGFYCSEYPQQAAEWAVNRDRNGFVTAYSINTDGLRIINLCSSQYNALHWLSVLLGFREFADETPLVHRSREYISKNFSVDYQGCDCIIGYRADNCCFAFAQDFLSGRISYQDLSRALSQTMPGGNPFRQFVLKSNRAFDRISFLGFEQALSSDHYPVSASRELRTLKSLNSYAQAEKEDALYIDRMIEERITPYDPRLI